MKILKLRKDLKIALLAWQGETETFRRQAFIRHKKLDVLTKKLAKLKAQERIHHAFFDLLKQEVGEAKYYELCKLARIPLISTKEKDKVMLDGK